MIRGEKVFLSADIPKDARAWRNNPAIWKWCRQYTLIDERQHARWLENVSTDPSIKMFGIRELKNEIFVGVCGLTSIDRVNQNAEFSLYIEESVQKYGFGVDALRTLLRHGFRDHNLHRIWGETYEGNPALKMFQSLGMEIEGTLRDAYFRDGKFINAIRVAITREEFNG